MNFQDLTPAVLNRVTLALHNSTLARKAIMARDGNCTS